MNKSLSPADISHIEANSDRLPHGSTRGEFAIEKVIEGDFCSGCGACAYVAPSSFSIVEDSRGQLSARKSPDASREEVRSASRVCPFAAGDDGGEDEDSLARRHFPDCGQRHAALGSYLSAYAGHVAEDRYRADGSSGGYTTWLLSTLLESGDVDAVLHVRAREADSPGDSLFAFAVSHSGEAIRAGAKSRYYPVTLAEMLDLVRRTPGRFAVTGVPCFIKAVRLLQLNDPVMADRIRYCIGLVCGHLKSRRFADLLAWQLGVEPGRLSGIDFRHKVPNRPASRYGVRLQGIDAKGQAVERSAAMSDLTGGDWGAGFFKYRSCEFCDDVLAETADVAVGDAWLPAYVKDAGGANVVVVRDPHLKQLTERAIADGALLFNRVSADTVMRSQEGGLRDRRSGLAYRLYREQQAGRWAPKKRVTPKSFRSDRWFRRQQELRSELASNSHVAFQRALDSGSLETFDAALAPALDRYHAHMRNPRELFRRVLVKIRNKLSSRLGLSIERGFER